MNVEVEMNQEEPMQQQIVLLGHHLQKQPGKRLADARIRHRSACVIFSFALSGQLVACSMQSDLSKDAYKRTQEATSYHEKLSIDDPTKIDKAREFEGQWSYSDDCDRGHYVTLEIKRESDQLIGSWSDGTLLRGSQGLLKGRVNEGRLIAAWCSEDEGAGAPARCPEYEESDDYLVVRDGILVWYQRYGQSHVEYVVLKQGSQAHQPMESCNVSDQGVGR